MIRIYDGTFDEIVLIDSSSSEEKEEILTEVYGMHCKSVIRIYDAPPTGIVEVLRTYGINKCSGEWILNLDSDELISDFLKNTLRDAIRQHTYHGFAIERVNYDSKGRLFGSKDFQVRLYKRDSVSFLGYLHERPIINGQIGQLKKPNYIVHNKTEDQWNDMIKDMRYESITARYSFASIIDRTKNQLFFNIEPVIKWYVRITSRTIFDELSYYEYFFLIIFGTLYNLAKYKQNSFKNTFFFMFYLLFKLKYIYSLTDNERKLTLRIAESIQQNGGPIRFMGFDKEDTVLEKAKELMEFSGDARLELTKTIEEIYFKNARTDK
jgi:glycosyltransferase involved in cell wall biosynthesis